MCSNTVNPSFSKKKAPVEKSPRYCTRLFHCPLFCTNSICARIGCAKKINESNTLPRCTLHRYTIGDHFAKHIDLAKGYEERRYNLGIQLNDEYDGGEYVTWDDSGNEILISKETGTALAYHCRVEHEIKEITKGERWSIVMPITKYNIIEKKSFI